MTDVISLIALAKEKQVTIGSCESLTAGLFTSTLASVPGASSVLKGGLVTYHTHLKEKLAYVDPMIVEKDGVISQNCANAMAEGARQVLDVDYCISFTGNAGPDAMEGKPAGCVYCAIASKHSVYEYAFLLSKKTRNEVREDVVREMISALYDVIKKENVWQN